MATKTRPDFGKWLTYEEGIYSKTALDKGIDNTPTQAQYNRMVETYRHVYAPLCEYYGVKLPVTSFFRSPALNRAVGGSAQSEHMKGGAIDINCRRFNHPLTNNELFAHVRATLSFDQLIFEAPDARNVPGWVHIAHRPGMGANRGQVLLAQLGHKGDMFYKDWPWKGGSGVAAVWLAGLLAGAFYYFTRTNS